MADIFWILGHPSYEALCAMTLTQLAEWHNRAAARQPRS